MQVLTDEQRRAMDGRADGFAPPRPRLGDLWLAAVDVLVRILTLGRGRVMKVNRIGPIHWDGAIKRSPCLGADSCAGACGRV